MKKPILILLLFIFTLPVFAQRLPIVGIVPFEATGTGVSAGIAEEATRMVVAELESYGTITVLSGEQAERAEYIVRGQITRQNNELALTATTSEARSGRTLNTSREQGPSLTAQIISSLCYQLVEHVPFPNFLLGRWRSTIDTIDGPLTCILEFRADRTVRVDQYDTWEHNAPNSLRYQAIGSGTYTYAGYLRRTVTVGRQQLLADATVNISLTLEDALPKYTSIDARSLRVLFNDDRSSFELVVGGLPCGDNRSGPSVFPSSEVFYTRFTKIN